MSYDPSTCRCGHDEESHDETGIGYCSECQCTGFVQEQEEADEDQIDWTQVGSVGEIRELDFDHPDA